MIPFHSGWSPLEYSKLEIYPIRNWYSEKLVSPLPMVDWLEIYPIRNWYKEVLGYGKNNEEIRNISYKELILLFYHWEKPHFVIRNISYKELILLISKAVGDEGTIRNISYKELILLYYNIERWGTYD